MLQKIRDHKYLITASAFVLWMLFFDRNNIFDQIKLRRDLHKLKEERAYYLEEIEKAQKDYNELFTNSSSLEKFAREIYLMTMDNEDIFVIVEED